MRPITTIAWITVLLLGGAAAYRFSPWWKGAEKPPAYDTAKLGRGAIVAKVTASGTLSALVTVQVGSQVSGRIKKLHADFNSDVKKGQLIAKIDPQLFIATLGQARANYNAAKADLLKSNVQSQDAERQLKRTKSLAEQKLVADADFDTAQANADVAKAQIAASAGRVEQTLAALHQAEVNLTYTTIESPIDGVVISRNVDTGQTVAASMQAPILFVIAEDLHKMHVDTSVAEADVGKLTAGMKATFNVDAYPNEKFDGDVKQIRNSPQTVQNVVTYDAVIDVQNPDLKLRPGMTANVTFVYAEQLDVLRVPNAALRFRPAPEAEPKGGAAPRAGGTKTLTKTLVKASNPGSRKRTLYLLRGDKAVPVEVTTGITDGSYTEVVAGELREGDTVITDTASTGVKPAAAPGGGQMPMRRVL
ncbi:MAG TPA: efflux RND transporter periplasmic adaptor subunit [Polyangiales bacterium]|nr:efflux RND transporter periplasmic adaptor subunit [Polyangiales bacterium]